jgi:2'-hydroxyisoflavone reductase
MQETVNDTLQWFHSLPAERQAKPRAGIDPQKEASLLSAWHASGGKKPA